jgi:preprotein translocase subunit SecG
MKSLHAPFGQLRSSWMIIGWILAISAVLVSLVLFLHFGKGIPIGNLTRDPTAILGSPFYTGFLSQIGIFFWSASATVCLFSAKVLSNEPESFKIRRFLFVSGLLTLILGLDDAFLLHEEAFPRLGIPEKIVFASYAGFVLFYLARFYSIIVKTEYILLGMALIFFGGSIALDVLNLPGSNSFLIEDDLKLVGIVSWLSYFFRTGVSTVDYHAAQRLSDR